MTTAFAQVGPTFGARLTGVDATRPLDPETGRAIEAGMDRDAVLVLPAQELTDATDVRFRYVHRWAPLRLAIWNNRQTLHRVRRGDAVTVRDMRRTTVAREVPTVPSQAAWRQPSLTPKVRRKRYPR